MSGRKFRLADDLTPGLAIFSLKYESLLRFDRHANEEDTIRFNLRSLFGVQQAPPDSGLRNRLDYVDPETCGRPSNGRTGHCSVARRWRGYVYWHGHDLLSMDGTGTFSSHSVHCANCCEKHHPDRSVEYCHRMMAAVVVHPEPGGLPLAPEPIPNTDGVAGNDCEREAAKRFIADLRWEQPHLPLIVLEDGLASNGPHIRKLRERRTRFILGAKPGNHTALFDELESNSRVQHWESTGGDGTHHCFRVLERIALNKTNEDLEVNVLECWATKPNGKRQHFFWVTDLPVNRDTAMKIMLAGRARRRIENETFNTLKHQGYNLALNFGHGDNHLSTVFASLMMLAFLIDPVEQRCCGLFRKACEKGFVSLMAEVHSAMAMSYGPGFERYREVCDNPALTADNLCGNARC